MEQVNYNFNFLKTEKETNVDILRNFNPEMDDSQAALERAVMGDDYNDSSVSTLLKLNISESHDIIRQTQSHPE